jgi:hypothetical protein
MTSFLDMPETKYLGIALFMLGAAYSIIKWVGRTLREQLGSGMPRAGDEVTITHVDNVPPMLVKQAIERGLVTAAQLSAMAPMERQFLFASMKERLSGASAPMDGAGGTATAGAPGASIAPGARGAPSAPQRQATPGVPHAMSGAQYGLASMPMNERLHLFCPTCGAAMELPAFAPYVSSCRGCGTKTAVREDVEGHYLLNVTPARKPEQTRGPSMV